MELAFQSLFGLQCTAALIGWDPRNSPPPPLPCSWSHLRGRYWSAKIDNISLLPPAYSRKMYTECLNIHIFSETKKWESCVGGGLNCPVMAGTDYWMENYSLLVGNFEADSHLILIRLTAAYYTLPSLFL